MFVFGHEEARKEHRHYNPVLERGLLVKKIYTFLFKAGL
jgi:hypothetical protein